MLLASQFVGAAVSEHSVKHAASDKHEARKPGHHIGSGHAPAPSHSEHKTPHAVPWKKAEHHSKDLTGSPKDVHGGSANHAAKSVSSEQRGGSFDKLHNETTANKHHAGSFDKLHDETTTNQHHNGSFDKHIDKPAANKHHAGSFDKHTEKSATNEHRNTDKHNAKAFTDTTSHRVSNSKAEQPANTSGAIQKLRAMNLLLPIDKFDVNKIKGSFYESRGGQRHGAADMLAPRNTPIRATSDGVIARLFQSRLGGTTIYQFDPSQSYVFYYAHLERYADGLHEGQHVKRGDVIGFVGTSGNAPPNTPHLHFSIGVLGANKQWWHATDIDPYEVFSGSSPLRSARTVLFI